MTIDRSQPQVHTYLSTQHTNPTHALGREAQLRDARRVPHHAVPEHVRGAAALHHPPPLQRLPLLHARLPAQDHQLPALPRKQQGRGTVVVIVRGGVVGGGEEAPRLGGRRGLGVNFGGLAGGGGEVEQLDVQLLLWGSIGCA